MSTIVMIRRGWLVIILGGVFLASPALRGVVSAQGPAPTTIAEILAHPVRDQIVTLSGQIVQNIKGNDYLLDDGTGQIVIDGGPIWYHRLDLSTGQWVSVTGEVSLGPPWLAQPRTPEIDIYSLVLADGTEISVRGPGRPSWAGGPWLQAGEQPGQGDRESAPPPWTGEQPGQGDRESAPPPWTGEQPGQGDRESAPPPWMGEKPGRGKHGGGPPPRAGGPRP